jgi:hypothetical protein
MSQLIPTVGVLIVAAVVALVLRQRRRPDAPTQPRSWPVPTQLDRNDFARPDAPWLVALFTSETCANCEKVVGKARVLESADVAYQEVSYQQNKALHDRYSVEAVPMLLFVGADGVVVKSFVGEMSAIDLWGEIATVRDPSSAPSPDASHAPPHLPHDH